ncbi:glycosyltransferase [Lysobacter korlensis]|uniref:Glycosyltransferase n=1 Tax=Lysobacter korlensis TaxID=553636 RepID=A0ABV6RWM7_9GAMM
MRILLWPVHGTYTDALVRGQHEYLLPWTPEGGPFTGGRGGYDPHWPENVRDTPPARLRDAGVDVVIVQRLEEIQLAERWLERKLGRDIPAVFLEHNAPRDSACGSIHPLADQRSIPLVHVTHFNEVFWDSGRAPSVVIEHGVVDPGYSYTGTVPHLAVVVNEPARRGRVVGADLLPRFTSAGPIDLFGIDGDQLPAQLGLARPALTVLGDVPLSRMHPMLAERRVYLHPFRWTSLGLALLEAMHLGLPVVALASTEVPRALPPEAGAVSSDIGELAAAARSLLSDPDEARRRGRIAREAALARYGHARFLRDWDTVLGDAVGRRLAA